MEVNLDAFLSTDLSKTSRERILKSLNEVLNGIRCKEELIFNVYTLEIYPNEVVIFDGVVNPDAQPLSISIDVFHQLILSYNTI